MWCQASDVLVDYRIWSVVCPLGITSEIMYLRYTVYC